MHYKDDMACRLRQNTKRTVYLLLLYYYYCSGRMRFLSANQQFQSIVQYGEDATSPTNKRQ